MTKSNKSEVNKDNDPEQVTEHDYFFPSQDGIAESVVVTAPDHETAEKKALKQVGEQQTTNEAQEADTEQS